MLHSVLLRGLIIAIVWEASRVGAAEDNKKEVAQVTAWAPLSVTPGTTFVLRARGMKLDEATELRFSEGGPAITATLKEKKKSAVPTGFEEKEIGGTEVEFSVNLPADYSGQAVEFSIVTNGGTTAPRTLRVLPSTKLADEEDPNGGFHESQKIEPVRVLRGMIKEEKDVDVFRFHGTTGQRVGIDVFAARGGSLLDSVLTLCDSAGKFLCTNDDGGKSSDSSLKATLPADGDYLVVVQDAHDRGSSWHQYELSVTEAP